MQSAPKINRAIVLCYATAEESQRTPCMGKLICGLAIVYYEGTNGFLLFQTATRTGIA